MTKPRATAPRFRDEILEAIRRRREDYAHDRPDHTLEQAIDEFFDVLEPPFLGPDQVDDPLDPETWLSEPQRDDLWMDLRPSETGGLLAIRAVAIESTLRRCREVIVAGIIAGAEEFAERYPDARRAPSMLPIVLPDGPDTTGS